MNVRSQARHKKHLSLGAKAWLTCLVITTVVMLATALSLWADYRDTEQRRFATAEDVTRVVERHILDTTAQAEVLIDDLARLVLADGTMDNMVRPARWEQMKTDCAAIIGCHAIGAINPQGKSIANSRLVGPPGLDVSDRAYFKTPIRTGHLFIGPAVVTRLPGNPILFHISKAVFDKQNRPLGVIAVAMNTTHLTELYQMMDFSTRPTVTVFRANGEIVARYPDMRGQVGKSNWNGPLFQTYLPRASHGTYLSVSVLDGKTRLAAYRAMPEQELVIYAGIEADDAFAQWRTRSERTGLIVAAVLGVVWVTLYAGYRALAREFALRTENRALDALSYRDGLTGIANRRLLDITLKRDWARHARARTPLALLMIDVDHFKAFNDRYGHQAGDEVLRAVALALSRSLHREADLVGRYGGEEFVAILDNDLDGALLVAERMRSDVERLAVHLAQPTEQPVTVSIGVACAVPEADLDVAGLMHAADSALYQAKSQGRNRVCVQAADTAGPQLSVVA